MPEGNQDGHELHERVGVVGNVDPVVAEDVAHNVDRDSTGLVVFDIVLHPVNGPEVIQGKPHKAEVGPAGTSHLKDFVSFFIVSKEKVSRNYSNAKGKYT
jgi:hypothetical protein